MKSFNFNFDDCFDSACDSLGKEMGISAKQTTGLENELPTSNYCKKKKTSFFKELESACLIILASFFI